MRELINKTMQTMKLNPWLVLVAFFGGSCLSLSELMNMFSKHQSADLFFFGGMFIAGVMGIAAYIIAGAENLKTAFLSGVAAPQLLGGVLKAGASGATVVGMLMSSMTPSAYAQGPIDSTKVYVDSKIDEALKITTQDGKVYELKDTLTLPSSNTSAVVSGTDFSQEIIISGAEVIVKVRYSRPLLQKAAELSRGMFGRQVIDVKPTVSVKKKSAKKKDE
jgi:hypothetical protein